MMMDSPARAQRRARPMPRGPVPPIMAMGRVIRQHAAAAEAATLPGSHYAALKRRSSTVAHTSRIVPGILRASGNRSCELGLERVVDGEFVFVEWQLDVEARVCGIALGGDAADFEDQRLKIFGAGVLA